MQVTNELGYNKTMPKPIADKSKEPNLTGQAKLDVSLSRLERVVALLKEAWDVTDFEGGTLPNQWPDDACQLINKADGQLIRALGYYNRALVLVSSKQCKSS